MLAQYLRFITGQVHDKEYKFFKNVRTDRGTAVIIGYDQGRSLTTFRAYNKSHSIVQFEKDPSLESQIRAMSWIAGKDFKQHMVQLSCQQNHETVFLGKTDRLELSTAGDSTQLRRFEEQGQLVIETRLFDSFQLHPDEIIINSEDFRVEILEGMNSTLSRCKPTFMVPNLFPTIVDVTMFLSERSYRPYLYDPGSNSVRPFDDKAANTHVFFVHGSVFQTDELMKL